MLAFSPAFWYIITMKKTTKGYETMKKILIGVIALLAIVGISPAQASPQPAVAIIDVNFESQLIDGKVTEICVSSPVICNMAVTPRGAVQLRAFNHGTIMADIARTTNPDAHLVLIEAGSTKTGVVTGNQLLVALNWVMANAAQHNIKAVSFSYNSGNGARCTPSSPGINVTTAHNNIVAAISSLRAAGVKLYASSGNHGSTRMVDYPACISDAISVGSSGFHGSAQLSDIVLSGDVYTSPKLKSVRTAVQGGHDSFPVTLSDSNPFMAGFTTSVATVIAAVTNK